MRIIAHRGNLDGPNLCGENHPTYIRQAIILGYDAEVDLLLDGQTYMLGHDVPYYRIDESFLLDNADRLWIHCKNAAAFRACAALPGVHYFWHGADAYTLTSKGHAFTRPGEPLVCGGIAVMPEYANYTDAELRICFGICTDRAAEYRGRFSK